MYITPYTLKQILPNSPSLPIPIYSANIRKEIIIITIIKLLVEIYK